MRRIKTYIKNISCFFLAVILVSCELSKPLSSSSESGNHDSTNNSQQTNEKTTETLQDNIETPIGLFPEMTNAISIVTSFNSLIEKFNPSVLAYITPDITNFWAEGIPDCVGESCPCESLMGKYCNVTKNQLVQEIQSRIQSKPRCAYEVGGDALTIFTWGWNPLWTWPYGETDFVKFVYIRESEGDNYRLSGVTFIQYTKLSSISTTLCP